MSLCLVTACGDSVIEAATGSGTDETDAGETSATEDESGTNDMGEGDTGDGDTGDGDGDMGDGDTGDGDGDTGDGDGDGDTGDGDGDTGDGDGDGDTGDGDGDTGDGDGDGDLCGDGMVNGDEDCDDQNDDNADGCLSNCTFAATCLDILEVEPEAPSGMYTIAPKPGAAWMAECDMETDGGGWTGLSVEHTCNGDLDSNVVEVDDASTFEIDGSCRPYTRDGLSSHTYYWDIEFPPTFESFYLHDYYLRANAGGVAQSEIRDSEFVQGSWGEAHGNQYGDVSFGSGLEDGPQTSYANAGADFECEACEEIFPALDTPVDLPQPSDVLRIGWGEAGVEAEGWYPWYSGVIFVR